MTPVGSNCADGPVHDRRHPLVLPITTTPGRAGRVLHVFAGERHHDGDRRRLQRRRLVSRQRQPIVNYAWDWGDGTTDNFNASPAEDHDWAGAGSYSVTLTVTDDLGQRASTTQLITVGYIDGRNDLTTSAN